MATRRLALVASLFFVVLATGCGGPQTAEDPCQFVTADSSPQAISLAMACGAETPPPAGPDLCRTVAAAPLNAPPEALEMAVGCVLEAGERLDGAWVAELIDAISSDPVRVDAVGRAIGDHLDPAVHGNSFAAALTRAAQTALGDGLQDDSVETRDVLVSLALAFGLSPLSDYAGSYVRELDPQSDVLQDYAATLDPSSAELDESDRYALAATGTWSAWDLVQCWRHDAAGCAEWDGESPLELLAVSGGMNESSPGPNALLRMIRTGEGTSEEMTAAAWWLLNADYPNNDDMRRSVLFDMTSPNIPESTRRAIAAGMGGELCEWSYLGDFLMRAAGADPTAVRSETDVWATVLGACSNAWTVEERLVALAHGHWLAAPAEFRSAQRARIGEETAGMSCGDLMSLAQSASEQVAHYARTGPLAYAILAEVHSDACGSTFAPELEAVVADSDVRPEARLGAGDALLTLGDDRVCGEIDDILDYFDSEYEVGPTPTAEARAAQLRERCASAGGE